MLALCALPLVAHARVTVVAPSDWVTGEFVHPDAAQRATRWAADLGGTLVSVHASKGADDYVETMAVVERVAAMPENIIDDSDAAARWLDAQVKPFTGGSAAEEMSWERTPDAPAGFLHARYGLGDIRLTVLAVPDGDKTSFILLTSRPTEDLFYGPIFEDVRKSVAGGEAPLHAFDVGGVRTWNFVGWLLALPLVYGLSLAFFSERRGDHRRVGRIAFFILAGLAVLAAILAWLILRAETPALLAAGSSASAVATEVFAVGAGVAGVAYVLGQLFEGKEERVQSAPAQADLAARIQAAKQDDKVDA